DILAERAALLSGPADAPAALGVTDEDERRLDDVEARVRGATRTCGARGLDHLLLRRLIELELGAQRLRTKGSLSPRGGRGSGGRLLDGGLRARLLPRPRRRRLTT